MLPRKSAPCRGLHCSGQRSHFSTNAERKLAFPASPKGTLERGDTTAKVLAKRSPLTRVGAERVPLESLVREQLRLPAQEERDPARRAWRKPSSKLPGERQPRQTSVFGFRESKGAQPSEELARARRRPRLCDFAHHRPPGDGLVNPRENPEDRNVGRARTPIQPICGKRELDGRDATQVDDPCPRQQQASIHVFHRTARMVSSLHASVLPHAPESSR